MTIGSPASRSTHAPDVSALIVNYNSGRFATELVRTLEAQRFRGAASRGRLEIIVLDNHSPDDQRPLLEPLRERGVNIVYHHENRGYAGGANAALRHATGRYVLILNSDVLIAPDAVDILLSHLCTHPRTGLVGPRGWHDPAYCWLLPQITLPTFGTLLSESCGMLHQGWARRLARARSRAAAGFWTKESTFPWPVLAGFGFMMPADLARRLGPFDENFPLYYEDCDLARRVRRAGYAVEIVPSARMVHLYNRSAGQDSVLAMEKHDIARRYYYRKFYGPLGVRVYDGVIKAVRDRLPARRWTQLEHTENLGSLTAAPRLRPPHLPAHWWAELAVDPCFFWKAGHYGSGDSFEMPEATWECLEPSNFFVRFLHGDTLAPIATYAFRKTAPPTVDSAIEAWHAAGETASRPPGSGNETTVSTAQGHPRGRQPLAHPTVRTR